MDLTVDDKTRALREMVRVLGREHLRPLGLECDARNAPLDPDHPFFGRIMDLGLGGRGLAGLVEDERQAGEEKAPGRPSSGARRAVVLAEEAAYWDRAMATSLPGPGLAATPVRLFGTPEQRRRWLGIFEDRSKARWAAFAMTEPGAGSDVARIRTSARRVAGGWELRGEKMFISNGARASWVVVFATVDPSLGRAGHRAFVVERGTPGFSVARVEKKMGLAASETASLVFEDVRVPDENLLGGEDRYAERDGFKLAMRTFDITRPVVGAMAVGIGQAAIDAATEQARALGVFEGHSHRALRGRHKLIRARRLVDAARLLCWRAACLADAKRPNSAEAAMAKAYAPRAALEAVSLTIESLGPAAAAADRLLEKLFRDVKALDIVEGTGQIQRLVLARRLLGFEDDAADAAQS
jgi:acyl-CoA dehydrogenase